MNKQTDRTIAILGGTGNEGPGLAMRWASAGLRIIIGSRQAEKAHTIARELNEKLELTSISGMENGDAAQAADIAVLTVNQAAHQAALESLKGKLANKILVDATARVDYRDPKPPNGASAGRIAQEILGPKVRVVAAFQNVPAHALPKNLGQPLDIDVLVCADDDQAAQEAIELVERAGMHGYYAGNLDNALVVEGLTALIITMNKRYKSRTGAIRVTGIQQ